jgi:exonuclease VII small subunit
MTTLDDAVKRLERAVARLEKASGRMAEGAKAHNGRLSAAEADHAALLETTEHIATRLDAAILRIDRALEG